MVRPLSAALCCLFVLGSGALAAETVDDRMDWPPLFARTFGCPGVVVRERSVSRTSVTHLIPLRKVLVKTAPGTPRSRVDHALREHFLRRFWDEYLDREALTEVEQRLEMEELIPLDRCLFQAIGHRQLAGASTGSPVHDAWWKVRLGLPLTESREHLLSVTTLVWDDPEKQTFGHYSIVLRRRGGDAAGDAVFDFRAPWTLDRRPRVTEAPNIHNRLKLRALHENLYDWLYTQTEYRNCHVNFHFVSVHEEQVVLLEAFKGRLHEAGNFRPFKKNCASLGLQFANRLLPLDQRIGGEDAFADLPYPAAEASVEKMGGAIFSLQIENRTQERGREPTSNSTLRAARPSRTQSRPYRLLLAEPAIN